MTRVSVRAVRQRTKPAPRGISVHYPGASSAGPHGYWVSTPPWPVAVEVVVEVDVEVSVTVDVWGVVVVEVVVVVVGVVVVVVGVVVVGVVVVEELVEVVVVLDEVVVELPLSSPETTASAIPRPRTAATRTAITAFMPPLMPVSGGSPGGWP
jgi:hypothetical protein